MKTEPHSIEYHYKGNEFMYLVPTKTWFVKCFGTTIDNHNMHFSWQPIDTSFVPKELKEASK
jgi:hypothetical protein